MHFHGVNIPEDLISAAYTGSLVVFAGAGVSMQKPVCFPSFNSLVTRIKDQVDPAGRYRDRRQKKISDNETVYTETPEQYLSSLESAVGNVRQACCSVLPQQGKTSELHKNLLRLFPRTQSIKIVTTNFDDCFEVAIKDSGFYCESYSSPALPYGDTFCGLAHLHGSVESPESMVLLAEDYGRAYVTNGWATRFLVDLFEKHTVLFIGYSCGDSLVDYLTRSISSHINGKAYAFCRSSEDDSDWLVRGIAPISYDKYSDLPLVIGDWAAYLEQSVTDRVRKLKKIAKHTVLTEIEKEYIVHSFNWHNDDDQALFTREFCSESSSFEHLAFITESGRTSFLTDELLSETDWELLQWTISCFSINNCSELQQLCASIRNRLSMRFFDRLTWHFLLTDAPANAIGPWIAWLESMPQHYYSHCAHSLLELAAKCEEPEIFFAITRMLLRVNLSVSNDIFSGAKQEPTVAITDKYYEDKLFEGIKKHRAKIGVRVFDYCFQQIEFAYSIQTGCWTNPNAFDSMSYSRSAVEPHSQDQYTDGAGSILLDVIRESVDSSFAIEATERCLSSNCAILVRLGLWLTNAHFCSGEALDLIRRRDFLSDYQLHHEIFQLVQASFALASEEQRLDFSKYLKQHFALKADSDYECFSICDWILKKTPHDEIAKLKAEVLSRNPNYQPREHPDFTHYMTSGFVDNVSECKIDECLFTIEEMIRRLGVPPKPGSFVTALDIVSVPCRDYPDTSFRMIQKLLARRRTDDESRLCNLLIKTLEWNSPYIPAEKSSAVFAEILNQHDLCIEGIKALASFTLSSSERIKWKACELTQMLSSASSFTNEFLNAEPAIQPRDDSDWLLIGINHPIGKYLQLVVMLDQLCYEETGGHSKPAKELLFALDPISMDESVGSKALIACFFENLNLWTEIDRDYAKSAANILAAGDWALVPAWQGMARLNRISAKTWEITKEQWRLLFCGEISVGKERLDALVRLYVWIVIVHAKNDDKARMLKSCGSWSKAAFESACYQIDNWLETLNSKQKMDAWNEWLSESFEFTASVMPSGGKTLASIYCRWARKYSELRPIVAQALIRDCANINEKELFVHDGLLTDIAQDEHLAPSAASSIVAFLLNHQRHFMYEEDARTAARFINLAALSDEERTEIEDAYTRRGMLDVEFGKVLTVLAERGQDCS